MGAMTPEEARAYLARWKLVREVEAAELRRTSMEMKLRQLAALMQVRSVFGGDSGREAETQVIRERWARIKRHMDD